MQVFAPGDIKLLVALKSSSVACSKMRMTLTQVPVAALLVCAAALWVGSVTAHSHQPNLTAEQKEKQKDFANRLKESGYNLNKLTARIFNLKEKLETRKRNYEEANLQSRHMMQRIDRRGSGLCDFETEYNCANAKCVPHNLVCDGQDDCGNNADEGSEICTFPGQKGTVWRGRFVNYDCNEEVITDTWFRLDSVEKRANAPSTAKVKGLLYWRDVTYPNHRMVETLPYEGIYNYGDRTIHFQITYGGELYDEVMYFVPGDADVLHYDIFRANTHTMCGRAYMTRED